MAHLDGVISELLARDRARVAAEIAGIARVCWISLDDATSAHAALSSRRLAIGRLLESARGCPPILRDPVREAGFAGLAPWETA